MAYTFEDFVSGPGGEVYARATGCDLAGIDGWEAFRSAHRRWSSPGTLAAHEAFHGRVEGFFKVTASSGERALLGCILIGLGEGLWVGRWAPTGYDGLFPGAIGHDYLQACLAVLAFGRCRMTLVPEG